MPIKHPYDFRTTPLDPGLLSTPFKVQTSWHVITGAPSCGKTTLIDLLSNKGFKTVAESARQYMEKEIAAGRTIAEIHKNAPALQHRFLEIQLCVESGLQTNEVIFLDGAVPGSLAWYRVWGLDPNEILPECFHHRYASVFILDRLPYQLDGFRYEDSTFPDFLDQWIAEDYFALGYSVVRVPVLAPEKRLALVLEKLAEQGLI